MLHSCGTSLVGGQVPTCDSAHWWWLYSAASLEHQAASIMTCYPNQSHLSWYWVNQSLPYTNNAERQAREQQVSILKSLVWLDQGLNTVRSGLKLTTFRFPDLPEQRADALLIQPPRLVFVITMFISVILHRNRSENKIELQHCL